MNDALLSLINTTTDFGDHLRYSWKLYDDELIKVKIHNN